MAFHVGQKVVCIRERDEWTGPRAAMTRTTFPVKDAVYTVRDVFAHPLSVSDSIYLRLAEIHNTPAPTVLGLFEAGFVTTGFRPVVERKTDISLFTAMLTPKKAKENA